MTLLPSYTREKHEGTEDALFVCNPGQLKAFMPGTAVPESPCLGLFFPRGWKMSLFPLSLVPHLPILPLW